MSSRYAWRPLGVTVTTVASPTCRRFGFCRRLCFAPIEAPFALVRAALGNHPLLGILAAFVFALGLATISQVAAAAPLDPQNTILLDTKYGRVTIKLRPDLAPKHVERIKTLTKEGFYDGLLFHRVIEGFVAQTGDPRGTGTGGSDLPDLTAEFSGKAEFVRGTVGMARTSDPNTANSQFFITYVRSPSLDGKYTIFGEVVSGMDAVDKLKKGATADNGLVKDPDKIIKMQLAADEKGGVDNLLAGNAAKPQVPIVQPDSARVAAPTTAVDIPPATSQRRVALVIGNADYPGAALANPTNDAADVSASLTKLGFEVVTGANLTHSNFSDVVSRFDSTADGADVALVYYSGHAMQIDGENWLMPVDARVDSVFNVRNSNISLDSLMRDVQTHAKMTLVFLDACRNNPLADTLQASLKSQNRDFQETRGLARIPTALPETLVVFATRPNDVAQDGVGRNSPFTRAFLDNVATPGIELDTMLKHVIAEVKDKTNQRQQPQRLSELDRDFYFAPTR